MTMPHGPAPMPPTAQPPTAQPPTAQPERRLDGRSVVSGAHDFDLSTMAVPGGSSYGWSGMIGVRDVGEVFVPGDGKPAGPARRIGAYVIDYVIGAGSAFLVGAGVLTLAASGTNTGRNGGLTILGLYLLAALIVPIGLAWLWGRTPGKKLVGIKIIDARTGEAPKWRSVVRWLVGGGYTLVLPVVVTVPVEAFTAMHVVSFGILLVSTLLLLVDPGERTIADRVAGTVVVLD